MIKIFSLLFCTVFSTMSYGMEKQLSSDESSNTNNLSIAAAQSSKDVSQITPDSALIQKMQSLIQTQIDTYNKIATIHIDVNATKTLTGTWREGDKEITEYCYKRILTNPDFESSKETSTKMNDLFTQHPEIYNDSGICESLDTLLQIQKTSLTTWDAYSKFEQDLSSTFAPKVRMSVKVHLHDKSGSQALLDYGKNLYYRISNHPTVQNNQKDDVKIKLILVSVLTNVLNSEDILDKDVFLPSDINMIILGFWKASELDKNNATGEQFLRLMKKLLYKDQMRIH